MHFGALVVGPHEYEKDLLPLIEQGKADYFSLTRGNFVRRRPGLQHYETRAIRNAARAKAVELAFAGEFNEAAYENTISVFGDDDVEYAGNIDFLRMSEISFEKDYAVTISMVEKYGQNPLKFLYERYENEGMSLREFIRRDTLWAPYVICDFLKPNVIWWERNSDNFLEQRQQQFEFITSLHDDTLLTLYHCHR
jgi:hypothetical protein